MRFQRASIFVTKKRGAVFSVTIEQVKLKIFESDEVFQIDFVSKKYISIQ